MDNKILRVNGVSQDRLAHAMELLNDMKAVGYISTEDNLTFFWTDYEAMKPFPYPMEVKQCAEIAFGWLSNAAKYPKEPDIDGDVKKGWLLYVDSWGHVEPYGWQAFAAVKPMWAMYGK